MKKVKNAQKKVIPFRCAHAPKYPNAADRRYYMNKIADHLLTGVTGFGIGVAMIFIFVVL